MVTRYYGIYVVYRITAMYRKHNQHLSFCYSLFNIALMNNSCSIGTYCGSLFYSFINLINSKVIRKGFYIDLSLLQ